MIHEEATKLYQKDRVKNTGAEGLRRLVSRCCDDDGRRWAKKRKKSSPGTRPLSRGDHADRFTLSPSVKSVAAFLREHRFIESSNTDCYCLEAAARGAVFTKFIIGRKKNGPSSINESPTYRSLNDRNSIFPDMGSGAKKHPRWADDEPLLFLMECFSTALAAVRDAGASKKVMKQQRRAAQQFVLSASEYDVACIVCETSTLAASLTTKGIVTLAAIYANDESARSGAWRHGKKMYANCSRAETATSGKIFGAGHSMFQFAAVFKSKYFTEGISTYTSLRYNEKSEGSVCSVPVTFNV